MAWVGGRALDQPDAQRSPRRSLVQARLVQEPEPADPLEHFPANSVIANEQPIGLPGR